MKAMVWITAAFFALGGVAALVNDRARRPPKPEHSSAHRPLLISADSTIVSEMLRVVVIVQSTCGICSSNEFARALGDLRAEVETSAVSRGVSLRFVGVAAEYNWRAGLRLLSNLGPFDEVSSGGGWLSEGAYAAFWDSRNANAVVPQVLVIREVVRTAPESIIRTSSDTVMRLFGLEEVRLWKPLELNDLQRGASGLLP